MCLYLDRKFHYLSWYLNTFQWPGDVIKNDWLDPKKSHGSLSVNKTINAKSSKSHFIIHSLFWLPQLTLFVRPCSVHQAQRGHQVEYIPRIMHTIHISCFVASFNTRILPISFRITSTALEPSYDGSSAGEIILNNMGNQITWIN